MNAAATLATTPTTMTVLHGGDPVEAVRDSGEHVQAVGLTMARVREYATARQRRPAVKLALDDYLGRLAEIDLDLAELLRDLAECDRTISRGDDELAAAFTAEERAAAGTLRLEAPGLLSVTWPKPAMRWVQQVKPERIHEMDPALAKRLGITQAASAPAKPTIKVLEPVSVAGGAGEGDGAGPRLGYALPDYCWLDLPEAWLAGGG